MAWIGYWKACVFIPHSWILECLDMLSFADVFWRKARRNGNFFWIRMGLIYARLTSIEASSTKVACRHWSLLFAWFLLFFKKSNGVRKELKLDTFLFMDVLKLFGKNDDQIDSLVQTVFTFSEEISIGFVLKKCRVVTPKKGKLVKFDEIHLPNQEIMKEVDENG